MLPLLVAVSFALRLAGEPGDTRAQYGGSLQALRQATQELERKGEADFLVGLLDFYAQRAYPYDRIDWGAYQRAEAQLERMPSVAGAADSWEYMGPKDWAPPKQRIYHGNSRISGRINSLAISPHNPSHILAGLPSGGVLRSTDGGVTWQSMTDADPKWAYLPVTSVAFDTRDARFVYASAGDYNAALPGFYRQDPFSGLGIRAYPYGLWQGNVSSGEWTQLAPKDGAGDYFEGQSVSQMIVEPKAAGYVIAGTGRGVKNGGKGKVWRWDGVNWTNPVTEGGNPVEAQWSSVAVSPIEETPKRRLIYTVGQNDGKPLMYKSVDRGVKWTQVELTPIKDRADVDMLRVATSVTRPQRVYVAAHWNDGADKIDVWRSDNAGKTWTSIKGTGLPDDYNFSQGGYDFQLTVTSPAGADAKSPDVVYLGLVTLAATADPEAASPTWKDIGLAYDGTPFKSKSLIHNDQQSMAVDFSRNQSELYAGCDGGVYRIKYDVAKKEWAVDSNASDVLNSTLRAAEFNQAAFHPTDPAKAAGGTQDNANIVSRTIAKKLEWQTVGTGDGASAAINFGDPKIQYTATVFYGATSVIYRTTNEWSELDGWDDTGGGPEDVQYTLAGGEAARAIPMLFSDPNPPNRTYLLTDVVRYHAGAMNWKEVEASNAIGLNAGDYLMSLGISTVPDAQVVVGAVQTEERMYAGSFAGRLFMRKYDFPNAQFTWYELTDPKLPNRVLTSIAVNPLNPDVLYVAFSGTGSGHVFKVVVKDEKVDSVTDLTGAGDTKLPDLPVNTIALDPSSSNTIYAGTDVGVLTSPGNAAWARMSPTAGIPNVRTSTLQTMVGNGYIHAATYGKGLYRIDRFKTYEFYGGEADGRRAAESQFVDTRDDAKTQLVFDDVDVPAGGAIISGFRMTAITEKEINDKRDLYFELRTKLEDGKAGELVSSGFLTADVKSQYIDDLLGWVHSVSASFNKNLQVGLPEGKYFLALAIRPNGDETWKVATTQGAFGLGSPLKNGNAFVFSQTSNYVPVEKFFGEDGPWDFSIGLLKAVR